ncbi:hypothetical protein MNB_SV-3-615 [hydrothermal vent metagenome]|uniref:Uncharacterized protein n=1 Tax=hydrothermal vent metagenome TaxID=652676 RepID=A0A1W1CVM6_9ZZZZ
MHPQLQQLINLLLLLIAGKYTAHIYLAWKEIAGILLFTFFIEHLLYYLRNKTLNFISFSSLSTAIGVMLMMVTPHYIIYFAVVFFALLQKQFLHYHGKHFFNPSNFALISGLLFFYHDAHIVLGQLGDQIWMLGAVGILGVSILYRVNRWIVPVSFILTYLLFQYFIIIKSDPVLIMESIYYRFYSVSFIVFILFMLTDPKTTPVKPYAQVFFATILSLLATILDYFYGFRVQHLFIVLFFSSPWIVLIQEYKKYLEKRTLLLLFTIILLLSLSAIIYIQIQPPYYFEMDK